MVIALSVVLILVSVALIVMRGLSDAYGSWKTIWMSPRIRRSAAPLTASMSVPR